MSHWHRMSDVAKRLPVRAPPRPWHYAHRQIRAAWSCFVQRAQASSEHGKLAQGAGLHCIGALHSPRRLFASFGPQGLDYA